MRSPGKEASCDTSRTGFKGSPGNADGLFYIHPMAHVRRDPSQQDRHSRHFPLAFDNWDDHRHGSPIQHAEQFTLGRRLIVKCVVTESDLVETEQIAGCR